MWSADTFLTPCSQSHIFWLRLWCLLLPLIIKAEWEMRFSSFRNDIWDVLSLFVHWQFFPKEWTCVLVWKHTGRLSVWELPVWNDLFCGTWGESQIDVPHQIPQGKNTTSSSCRTVSTPGWTRTCPTPTDISSGVCWRMRQYPEPLLDLFYLINIMEQILSLRWTRFSWNTARFHLLGPFGSFSVQTQRKQLVMNSSEPWTEASHDRLKPWISCAQILITVLYKSPLIWFNERHFDLCITFIFEKGVQLIFFPALQTERCLWGNDWKIVDKLKELQ